MPIENELESPRVYFPKEDYRINKYLDIEKFLSMIQDNSLFFSRIDKLEDKYEGISPILNFEQRVNSYKFINSFGDHENRPTDEDKMNKYAKASFNQEKQSRKFTCINCWNKGENESNALWKIYTDSGKGVLIKSSISKIFKAFEISDEKIWISEINYIDRKTERISEGNIITPIINKSIAYNYEDEVRLIYDLKDKKYWSKAKNKNGIKIKININELIDEIVISPFMEEWYFEIISNLLNKYELKFRITQSEFK
jgi:hypothetical protein